MSPNVLMVGCGITSSIVGKLLKSERHNITISVWEKLSEPGGRFKTITGGRNKELFTNLGAQYITTSDEVMRNYSEIYSSLIDNNVITGMSGKVKGMKQSGVNRSNYVAVSGMQSIVNSFLKEVDYKEICYEHKLSRLDSKGKKWNAVTDSGKEELFDIIILTIPVPEILTLSGDIRELFITNSLLSKKLKLVSYSRRYALGLFFEEEIDTEYDYEYVDNDFVVRYVAYDSWKKKCQNKFSAATIHTTVQFGEKHSCSNVDDVEKMIMKHISENKFQNWPAPSFISTYFWNYSQVTTPYDLKPGAIVLSECPLLIAGGDGFSGSTFDECLFSAKTICDLIFKHDIYSTGAT